MSVEFLKKKEREGVSMSAVLFGERVEEREKVRKKIGGVGWTHLSKMAKLSRSASTTPKSRISFSSPPPTTYSITSPSILYTTTRPSYRITSPDCLFVLSIRPFSNAFCSLTLPYGLLPTDDEDDVVVAPAAGWEPCGCE